MLQVASVDVGLPQDWGLLDEPRVVHAGYADQLASTEDATDEYDTASNTRKLITGGHHTKASSKHTKATKKKYTSPPPPKHKKHAPSPPPLPPPEIRPAIRSRSSGDKDNLTPLPTNSSGNIRTASSGTSGVTKSGHVKAGSVNALGASTGKISHLLVAVNWCGQGYALDLTPDKLFKVIRTVNTEWRVHV